MKSSALVRSGISTWLVLCAPVAAALILAQPCAAGPLEFKFSIHIENGGVDARIPQPDDLVVISGRDVLPIVSIEPVPSDAPVLIILNSLSLSTSDMKSARRTLLDVMAEFRRKGFPHVITLIDPQQPVPVSLTEPAAVQTALATLAGVPSAAAALRWKSSLQMEAAGAPSADQYLTNIDQVSRSIKDAVAGKSALRVVLLGRDIPESLHDKNEIAAQLFNGFIPLIAFHGVSFSFMNYGDEPGFFSRLADRVGGRVVGGGTRADLKTALAGDGTKAYTVTARWEMSRFYYRPLPLTVQVKNSALPTETIRAPKSFWPLPMDMRLPTYEDLRLAASLREQLVSLTKANEIAAAIVISQRIIDLFPFSLDDRLRLVSLYQTADQLEGAYLLLEQSVTLFPDSWEIPYERGLLYERQMDFTHAIETYQAALALNPSDHEIDLRLARLNIKARRTTEAIARYDRVLGTELDNSSLRLELAGVLWTNEFAERAQREAARSIEFDKKNLPAYDLLIEIHLKKRQYGESFKVAQAALDQDIQYFPALRAAGLSLTELERHQEAIFYLELALQDAPRNFEMQYALYRNFNGLGQLQETFKALRAAISIDEKRPELYVNLAELFEKEKDFISVGKALEDGAAKSAGSFELYDRLARWQMRRGNLDSALAACRAAFGFASGEKKNFLAEEIGLLLLRRGELSKALTSFEDAGFTLTNDLTARINQKRETLQREGKQQETSNKLVLPGGIQSILRFAPPLQSHSHDEDFLVTLFSYLLDPEPVTYQVKDAPRQQLITFYREYLKFISWLRKEGLFKQELIVNLSTSKEDIKYADKILSYFDARVRTKRDKEGQERLWIESDAKKGEARRFVLKLLGFNPDLAEAHSSIKLSFTDETLPVILGADYWTKETLGHRSSPEEALSLWLEQPDLMRLYVALSELPNEARLWLTQNLSSSELREDLLPGLSSFGSMLRFNADGSLRIPSGGEGEQLWFSFLGAAGKSQPEFLKRLFTKDAGKALYYFAALSQASPEVGRYFHASPERFRKFYSQIQDFSESHKRFRFQRDTFDFADLLLLLEADNQGIYFPGTEKIWGIETGRTNSMAGGPAQFNRRKHGSMRLLGEEDWLIALMKVDKVTKALSGVRKYAVLKHLIETRPDLIDERAVAALESSFARFGGQYQLIIDLNMDADGLFRLLGRLDEFERGPKENKRTGIALFQASLAILQALARNHVLDNQQARQLSVEFLGLEFPSKKPGAQADQVSEFLRGRLMPLVNAKVSHANESDGQDVLVQGLAGLRGQFSFAREGQVYEMNFSESERTRIKSFLERQNLHPLAPLLRVYGSLERLRREPGKAVFDEISQVCQGLSEPQLAAKQPEVYRKAVVHTDLERLRQKLQKLDQAVSRDKLSQVKEEAWAVADELAPFLVESLVGLVYASQVTEDDIVSFADENFARKHDFALEPKAAQTGPDTWEEPDVIKDPVLGARIQGSLVGISMALAKLKGGQIEGGISTRFADPAFPATQRIATALMNPSDLSDEVLEYAASCMDLGKTLLATASIDRKIENYVDDSLQRQVGERRAFLIAKYVEAAEPAKAEELMLPSELFYLGEMFHRDQTAKEEYRWHFPAASRLDELSKDVSASGLSELGFPVASWYGLNTLMLESPAPIETMTTYAHPNRLAERSCELKLKLASLFWQMGLPAVLFKPAADRIAAKAIKEVGQSSAQDWQPITRAIQAVKEPMVIEIVTEILNPRQN